MDDKVELRATPEIMKAILQILKADAAEQIVIMLKAVLEIANEDETKDKSAFYKLVIRLLESTNVLKNYDGLVKQIKEIEDDNDATFN